jgi:hypothetical protein
VAELEALGWGILGAVEEIKQRAAAEAGEHAHA